MELDDIAEAAVVAFPTAEGGTRLVAYVVPVGRVTPSGWQIRRELADRVRPHMVPSVVVVLDALPVGARGKVDRAALPAPPPATLPYREPVGRERELANLYMQVLGLDRVGLDDDFFELGGDSLAAIELIAAIDEHFGVELSAPVLLESPTVARSHAVSWCTGNEPRRPSWLSAHTDTGTPFFCVAGGGSPATSLRALTELIDDHPCYGIQARGLEERARPDRTVEACATRYLSGDPCHPATRSPTHRRLLVRRPRRVESRAACKPRARRSRCTRSSTRSHRAGTERVRSGRIGSRAHRRARSCANCRVRWAGGHSWASRWRRPGSSAAASASTACSFLLSRRAGTSYRPLGPLPRSLTGCSRAFPTATSAPRQA